VFPHRGVYVHGVGAKDYVADVSHVMIINGDEPYRVSHPVPGGDATLTLAVDPAILLEVTPLEYRCTRERPALNRSSLRLDARTQVLAAQLRQRLARGSVGQLEAEAIALRLIRRTLGANTSHSSRSFDRGPKRLADQVKMLLSADPWQRWTLTTIAAEVGVTPVYLTDAFRRVEGIPLYRYHLRLRHALALEMLADSDDLTTLAIELGFHSHSHFSASFKKVYGQTPSEFKRSVTDRSVRPFGHPDLTAKDLDSAGLYVSRTVSRGCQQAHEEIQQSVDKIRCLAVDFAGHPDTATDPTGEVAV
jgi:AraC-like DNA-binding protein